MTGKFTLYLKILGGIVLTCLILVGAINWWVDPLNEFGRNWVGNYFQSSRQLANTVGSFPHDAILTGSSRTLHINPDDLCGYKFYNASFPSALPEEIYYYLEKYVKNERLIVIGLDFYMFNQRSYPLMDMDKWPDHPWPVYEYLGGWDVFVDSLQALYLWERKEPGDPSNGFSTIVNDPTPDMEKYHFLLKHFLTMHYSNYQFSEKRFELMERLKQDLDDRHVKYIVFTNPMQEDNWRVLHLSGSYEIYLQWEARLRKIFPDLKTFPEGQYSDRELYQNSDPSHYLPSVGAAFVNEMLGCSK